MEIRITPGAAAELAVDLLAVGVFEGQKPLGSAAAVDERLGGWIAEAIEREETSGKLNEVLAIHTRGKLNAHRVIVVGLGKETDWSIDRLRQVAGTIGRYARRARVTRLGLAIDGNEARPHGQAVVEGLLLGIYEFNEFKSEAKPLKLEEVLVAAGDLNPEALRDGARRGRILAESTNLARDLGNLPGNVLTPSELAERAEAMAREVGLQVETLGPDDMRRLGMNALLGVAQGSAQPPRLVVMHYRGDDADKPALALVGKGITFDSGGISIKPAEGMQDMKFDMMGAAAVVGAMRAIALLKPRLHVVGIFAACENMPSGTAQRPGDIVRAMNGKTIEIVNTDAEGRMILADALAYAVSLGAERIVDAATLTGACIIALGHLYSGLVTNDEAWVEQVKQAAVAAGERVWQLPGDPEYLEQMRSDVADIKHTGGRPAGTITAGLFLGQFVSERPWVHVDIAGTGWGDKEKGIQSKGGSGAMVRTFATLAERLAGA